MFWISHVINHTVSFYNFQIIFNNHCSFSVLKKNKCKYCHKFKISKNVLIWKYRNIFRKTMLNSQQTRGLVRKSLLIIEFWRIDSTRGRFYLGIPIGATCHLVFQHFVFWSLTLYTRKIKRLINIIYS